MKATYAVGLAMGCFVLGSAAVQTLHAQAKPPAYVFVKVDVKDEDGYKKDFLPKAQANTKEFGGKYIAGGFNKAVSFAGSPPPSRVVLLQFADMDALKAFEEKEQKNIAEIGSKLATFRIIGIPGVEQK
jgi:uncharacterized protein (DUF1330 family)